MVKFPSFPSLPFFGGGAPPVESRQVHGAVEDSYDLSDRAEEVAEAEAEWIEQEARQRQSLGRTGVIKDLILVVASLIAGIGIARQTGVAIGQPKLVRAPGVKEWR